MEHLVQTLGHEQLRRLGGTHTNAQELFPLTVKLGSILLKGQAKLSIGEEDSEFHGWSDDRLYALLGPGRFQRAAAGHWPAHSIEAALDDAVTFAAQNLFDQAINLSSNVIKDLREVERPDGIDTLDIAAIVEKWNGRYPGTAERLPSVSEIFVLLDRAKTVHKFAETLAKKPKPSNISLRVLHNPKDEREYVSMPVDVDVKSIHWVAFDGEVKRMTGKSGDIIKFSSREKRTPLRLTEKLKIAYPTLRGEPVIVLIGTKELDPVSYRIKSNDSVQAAIRRKIPFIVSLLLTAGLGASLYFEWNKSPVFAASVSGGAPYFIGAMMAGRGRPQPKVYLLAQAA